MTAEISRSSAYVSLMPRLKAVLSGLFRFRHQRVVALDERLDQQELSPHMARDLGLSDASLISDSRRADREA